MKINCHDKFKFRQAQSCAVNVELCWDLLMELVLVVQKRKRTLKFEYSDAYFYIITFPFN